jgi:hypothetical protein
MNEKTRTPDPLVYERAVGEDTRQACGDAFTGQTFPFTMVGFPPASGKTANICSVIVPLRMNFVGLGPGDHVFEPTRAVLNIAKGRDLRRRRGRDAYGFTHRFPARICRHLVAKRRSPAK